MPAPKNAPPGFYSYKHLEGADRVYLDRLRVNLQHDLLTVTGLPIKLWQDTEDIKWGQEWKKTIDKGLGDAAFFIPIITPGYLFSDVCKQEFGKFAAYEKRLGRTDLILPLIYVRPEDFDDEEAKKNDPIVRLCLERQYVGLPPIFDPLAMRVFRWFRGLGCGFGGRWKERSLAAAGA